MNKPNHVCIQVTGNENVNIGYVFLCEHFPKTAYGHRHKEILIFPVVISRFTQHVDGDEHKLVEGVFLGCFFQESEGALIGSAKQSADKNESATDQVLYGRVIDIDGRVAVLDELVEPFDQ